MGPHFSLHQFIPIDLSTHNADLPVFENPNSMSEFIENFKKDQNQLPYGGYLEKRNLYQSALFKNNGPVRDVHLGIDVWALENTPLYAPIEGKVHAMAYNDQELDYGYTIILAHEAEGFIFYSLYGHLSKSMMGILKPNESVKAGQLIGHIGGIHENGGWSPHVHFQVILDLQGNIGDYPGVCSEEERSFYKQNCPDPRNFILPKN